MKNYKPPRKQKNYEPSDDVYLYKNITKATLILPKKSNDNKDYIEPNETFRGGPSFLRTTPGVVIVEQIQSQKSLSFLTEENVVSTKENEVMQEKLILDQPEKVTVKGTIETIVENPNELKSKKHKKEESNASVDSLINEDPLAGITIMD